MTDRTLGELGERRIISTLLAPRYAANSPRFGNDCATVPVPTSGGELVVTTDPCPPPMAAQLGFDDLFYRGWLLATINLSDLAAAGAEPLGLITSLQLPATTSVRAFHRLLDGIDSCCQAQGTAVLGGNLKESPQLDLAATAVGICDTPPMTRVGARPGEIVVAVGELGSFWAGVLGVRAGVIGADAQEPLLRNAITPTPKVQVGMAARRGRLLTACMDNSDGLYPSLLQLAEASGTRVVLEGDALVYSRGVTQMANELKTEPLRLALGWGDWQLIGTCREEDFAALEVAAKSFGTELHRLGRMVEGAGVDVELGGVLGALLPLDSQRFAPDSWFSAGLDAYIDRLLHGPLQTRR